MNKKEKIFNHFIGCFLLSIPLAFSTTLNDHFFLPKYLLFWFLFPLVLIISFIFFYNTKTENQIIHNSLQSKIIYSFFLLTFIEMFILYLRGTITLYSFLTETSLTIWGIFIYSHKRYFNFEILSIYILISALIVSLLSICQYFGIYLLIPKWHIRGLEWTKKTNLVYSTLGNPNYICNFLTPAFALTLYRFIIKKNIFLGIATLVEFLAIVVTYSRAGIIISIFIAIIMAITFFKTAIYSNRKKIILTLLTLFVTLALATIFSKNYFLNPQIKNLKDRFFTMTGSIYKRYLLYKFSFYLILQHPLGIGPGNFTHYFLRLQEKLFPQILPLQKAYWTYPRMVHNILLQQFVDKGWITGFLFVVLLVLAFKNGWKEKKYLLLFPFLAFIFQGMVSFPLKLPASSYFFYFFWLNLL